MKRLAGLLIFIFVFGGLLGCPGKVPLTDGSREIHFLQAYWFESEKTTYVFFSVSGNKLHSESSFFEISSSSKKTSEYKKMDSSWSVHDHDMKPCGEELCGSFSFRADESPRSLNLRLRYHPESPLGVEKGVFVETRRNDGTGSGQSALLYGVFDETNARVQLRVHNNFGFPNHQEVEKYGMTRRFRVVGETAAQYTSDDIKNVKATTKTTFLFPAPTCPTSRTSSVAATDFRGQQAWTKLNYSSDEVTSACLKVETLDKTGQVLFQTQAIARKNPALRGENLLLSAPVRPTIKVPLLLSYCSDAPDAANLVAPQFLEFQKHVLGIQQTELDACFAPGKEDLFRAKLKQSLADKVKRARLQNSNSYDLFLTIVINHRLGAEFRYFQVILREELLLNLETEAKKISPRLVGAFIYDSNENFHQMGNNTPYMLWCPVPRPEGAPRNNFRGDGANCMVDQSGGVDFNIISAVAPLGPFPNLSSYEDYVGQYGTRGLVQSPDVEFRSVQTNGNSEQINSETVTFFDNERISIGPGEAVRICFEKDESGFLSSFKFKNGTSLYRPAEAHEKWLSKESSGVYQIGLTWKFPFLGSVKYDVEGRGEIIGFIPISGTGSMEKTLGDKKWKLDRWDVGSYLQRCERFCDHPYFDESGTYQVDFSWQEAMNEKCLAPVVPKAGQ